MVEYVHFTNIFLTNQAASTGVLKKGVINISPALKEPALKRGKPHDKESTLHRSMKNKAKHSASKLKKL